MKRTVILAAGDFPKEGTEPDRLLKSATRVIACDSAAKTYRERFHRWPDVIVGDFDSLPHPPRRETTCVRIRDQETNDLEKAISLLTPDDRNVVILGATGLREDHTIGNVYRAMAAKIPIVSEYGEFKPLRTLTRFKVWKGRGISVFASDPKANFVADGLKWPLGHVCFANPAAATLNRATSGEVIIFCDKPAYAYIERPAEAVRAVVSLGSNIEPRERYLQKALRALAKLPKTRLLDASEVRETEPVGVPSEFAGQKFLNQAAVFETMLAPLQFSRKMHAIETKLGRVRTVKNGPRTIDLDLILFGDVRMKTEELTLPHPRARKRAFVTEPLRELGIDRRVLNATHPWC